MLNKVLSIENLGLLHGSGRTSSFGRNTLIYAENGRGKSTFCSLLRSLQTGDTAQITRRRTIDRTGFVAATLIFGLPGPQQSKLIEGTWDHLRPEIRVFDATFVRDNVYSGAVVDASHRRNLLQFALGDAAVTELQRENLAARDLKAAKESLRSTDSALTPHKSGMPFSQFESLPQLPDIDVQIQSATDALSASRRASSIKARPGATTVLFDDWNPDEIFEALSSSLATLHEGAEALVRDHVRQAKAPGFEEWLRQGAAFEHDGKCPYCNQSLEGLGLIVAYQQYFDAAYATSLQVLESTVASFNKAIAGSALTSLVADATTQQARIDAWIDSGIKRQLSLDEVQLREQFDFIQNSIETLIQLKRADPLMPVTDFAIREAVGVAWKQILADVEVLNAELKETSDLIDAYKATLDSENEQSLLKKIADLTRQKVRWEPAVVGLLKNRVAQTTAVSSADLAQTTARENVRTIMDSTLSTYQTTINSLLNQFHAGFSIVEMKGNFRGASPQSEFAIQLRNKQVPLKDDAGPDFDSTLSEGDKRTLAFAFFVASLRQDPQLSTMIVVVDDPMSSMDVGRRFQTGEVLLDIAKQAHQLIVSSHDSVFLRMFRDRIKRDDKTAPPAAEIGLTFGVDGYSKWEDASLDRLCETDYLSKHREVSEHLSQGTHDSVMIGTHLRPLLEGYLHRRFPNEIPDGNLLGEAIIQIRGATSGPLIYAAGSTVDAIEAINTFAGNFHHAAHQGYVVPVPSPTEVRHHAQKTLDIIYGKP
jgi:wobble nucleotide-excising tRNase